MVRNFIENKVLMNKVCLTNVVLIPKKKEPKVIGDLRPISLFNVLYKVASKVLANRMKNMRHNIVSESRNAFIPDRLITDNNMVS